MILMKLHIKLAEARMSQKELSEKTGVRAATINAYYNGTYKHIAKDHLNAFCKVLSCNVSDLIEYVNDAE